MDSEQLLEIAGIDIRFESLKTRNPAHEARLLAALSEAGEAEPILVTIVEDTPILIDGFKRLRCLKRLGRNMAPCIFIAKGEAEGIVEWLRRTQGQRTNLYEEAGFVLQLYRVHGMSPGDIADRLNRSKAWVSMRLQFQNSIPDSVRDSLHTGSFPMHAWMYSVRPFMRVNGEKDRLGEEFVSLMSRERATLREIDILAREWFTGGEESREAIRKGNGAFILNRLQTNVDIQETMSAAEQQLFKYLVSIETLIRKIRHETRVPAKGRSKAFQAQAGVVCMKIVSNLKNFNESMEVLHAQC